MYGMARPPKNALSGSRPFTCAATPIPVIATLHWEHGVVTQVRALAIAWTSATVQIQWRVDWMTRTEWIPASDVKRASTPPSRHG